jgi:transmembrane sensor
MPDKRHQPEQPPGYAGLEHAALRRYVAGECTPEELRRVDAWASESSARRRYVAALASIYGRASADEAQAATAAWTPLAARFSAFDEPEAEVPFYRAPWERPVEHVDVRPRSGARVLAGGFATGRRGGWPFAVAAATAAIFAIGGVKAMIGTIGARNHPTVARPAAMRQIITATGQRAEIHLDDGSRVMLGVASRLRLSSDFGVRTRDVYLDGTAYFEVVHDSAHPFVVHTANAVARDVGTRFVVSAYPETHATRVVVRDGAVALLPVRDSNSSTHSVLLTGGHLGQLRAGDTLATTRRVDPALYTAWMQGNLVFHDVPLREAAAELERWYSVDVKLGDPSLGDVPISASFAFESFDEALSVVTTVLPLRAVRRGNVVTLYRRSGEGNEQ